MKELKIATFNIRNSENENKKDKANILVDIIKKENIDILGMQELTKDYEQTLKKSLADYKYYGKYRFGNNIFSKFKYNENNIIITNKRVIFNKTIWLPFIAHNFKDFKESILKKSITPRIATMIIISDKELGKVRVINTHLDYKIPSVKKRQLQKLKKLIFKYEKKYPVILTGDFNMESSNEDFKKFIEELEKNKIKKVKITENTYGKINGKGNIIDHIFIPESWYVLKSGVIDTKNLSDHHPVYVKIGIQEKNINRGYIDKIKKALNIKKC